MAHKWYGGKMEWNCNFFTFFVLSSLRKRTFHINEVFIVNFVPSRQKKTRGKQIVAAVER